MKTWEWATAVLDALETKFAALQDETPADVFKEIVIGWRKPRKQAPVLYILPDEDLISVPSVAADLHRLRYVLMVMAEKVTIKGSLTDAIKLAGRVQDAIMADRKVSDTCDNAEVLRWDYRWPYVVQYQRHHIALLTEYRKHLIPS